MSLAEFVFLGIDAAVLSIFYLLYRERKSTADAIKNAPVFDINPDLKDVVKDGAIPYAIVKGNVASTGQLIYGLNAKNMTGVIQKLTVKEHRIRWSYVTRLWTSNRRNVSVSVSAVPFALVGSDFRSSVAVSEPLNANLLSLTTVHNVFKPTKTGFWSTVINFLEGEHVKGFEHVEEMLLEGTEITGIGALVLENGKLKLEPPKENLLYCLCMDSDKLIVKNIEAEAKSLKTYCIILGIAGGSLLAYILYQYYRKYRLNIEKELQRRRLRQVIDNRETSQTTESESEERNEDTTCVVCRLNSREVLIMDCGHFCCCADCAQLLNPAICPICRGSIKQLVPAYLA